MNSYLFNVFWNFGEAENRYLRLFLMLDFRGWSGENDEEWSSGTDKSHSETSVRSKILSPVFNYYTVETKHIFQFSKFQPNSELKLAIVDTDKNCSLQNEIILCGFLM